MVYNEVKTYIIIALVVILAGGVLGYTYNRMKDFIHGPTISITSPHNGATVLDSFITVAGTARNISNITLNDRPIFIDEEGVLNEHILLHYGYNKITLAAQDRFGRMTEKTLEFVYK